MNLTLELVVALVSLAATLLAAGRVFFVTERDVLHLQREMGRLGERVTGHDAIAVEGKGAHGRLEERVNGLSRTIDEKASAESVEHMAHEIATLRTDIMKYLERIEKKLDERK